MKVNAEIINVPRGITIHQWIVARRDPDSAELWWWGTYDDEEYAYSVAQDIGNGVVLEKEDEA